MRITFVLPHAGLSGGIRVLAIYAQRLQQRGHQVLVVSTPWIPPERRNVVPMLRDRCLRILRRCMERLGWRSPGALGGASEDPSHFHGLDIEHIRITQTRPVTDRDLPDGDVVVATWWETAPWVAELSRAKGAKAYFVQDYGAHEGQPMNEVAATWKLPLHKITISKWLMQLIEQHCPEASGEIDYVPNAVDVSQFHALSRSKQSRPTVGFVYNPVPQKGCDVIVKAIELARRQTPDLDVVAYGPGDPSGESIPLPPGTQYWQYAPDEKLKEIYSGCDAWLFASRREGFGLPILEAMACRTPVIATPAGAAPELVGEGGGVLVAIDNPVDMAAAINRVVSLPDAQWRAMSDAAHATASRYTWDDATDLFESALFRCIEMARSDWARRQESDTRTKCPVPDAF